MKKIFNLAVSMFFILMMGVAEVKTEEKMEGVGFMDFGGYAKCPVLSNASARVVLGPQCGGRILEYALNGVNVIKLDPQQDGWIYVPGQPAIDPCGGRFDIGPEMIIPRHPDLWVGPWQAAAIGPRAVRLTSLPDKPTGVQSAAFTEDWQLVPFNFPADGKVDPSAVKQTIKKIPGFLDAEL